MKSIQSYHLKELFPEPTPDDVENYSKIIENDSSNAFAYFLRANAFARQKKYSESIEDLQKVLKLFTTGLPDTGVYVLTIPPDGVAGIEGLKEAIGSATNPPPDTLSHSVGFVMIGDKVSTGILTDLLAP